MAFDPFTGHFRPNAVAEVDPTVFQELKDSTNVVAEEAEFIRSHVGKDKQHIREIKARLRELEKQSFVVTNPEINTVIEAKFAELHQKIAIITAQAITSEPTEQTAKILDLASAMEFDLINSKLDQSIERTKVEILAIYKALDDVKKEIEQNKDKKVSSLVSVKIDETLKQKFEDLQIRCATLEDSNIELKKSLEITEAKMAKYFKTSIWVSVGTTILLIALKVLI